MNQKKDYEKFLEEFNKTIYVSKTAEYKRYARKTTTGQINIDYKIIWKEILEKIFGDNSELLFSEIKIKGKNNQSIYIKNIETNSENKINKITYMTKGKEPSTFFIMHYEIIGTNRGYSNIKITYEQKLNRTIAGFNGILGNMKFKKQAEKYNKSVIEFIKNKFKKL